MQHVQKTLQYINGRFLGRFAKQQHVLETFAHHNPADIMPLQALAELEMQSDSERITKHLASKALHVQLKGINGLKSSGLLSREVRGQAGPSLSLLIKFGRCVVEKPLPDLPSVA